MNATTQDRAAAGRAGRAASPWNRSAHATSARAQLSFLAYCKRGKRRSASSGTPTTAGKGAQA